MATYREAPKPKKNRRSLPVLGLLLAIALVGLAYGLSFPLVKFAEKQDPDIKRQFDDLREQYNQDIFKGNVVEIIFAGVLWFVMMGLAMFIVSAALAGTDAERNALKSMPVSPANKKAIVKQMKRDLKEAKRRAKEMEKRKK